MAKEKEELALIVAEELKPEVVFTTQGMDDLLKKIEITAKSFVIDSSTDEGRSEIKSLAYRVARSKTIIDELGKKYYEKAKKIVDDTNAQRKTAREFLDALKDEIRKPVTEWEEEQEKLRLEKIKQEEARITGIRAMIADITLQGENIGYDETTIDLEQRLIRLDNLVVDTKFMEFFDEALTVKKTTMEKINNALTKRQAYEKEQAELKAERDRQEKVKKEQEAAQKIIDDENKRIKEENDKIEQAKRDAEFSLWNKRISLFNTDGMYLDNGAICEVGSRATIATENQLLTLTDDAIDLIAKNWNQRVSERKETEKLRLQKEADDLAEKKLKDKQEADKLKAEQEAAEAARLEELKPDKDKLKTFYKSLTQVIISPPEIKDVELKTDMDKIIVQINMQLTKLLKLSGE